MSSKSFLEYIHFEFLEKLNLCCSTKKDLWDERRRVEVLKDLQDTILCWLSLDLAEDKAG